MGILKTSRIFSSALAISLFCQAGSADNCSDVGGLYNEVVVLVSFDLLCLTCVETSASVAASSVTGQWFCYKPNDYECPPDIRFGFDDLPCDSYASVTSPDFPDAIYACVTGHGTAISGNGLIQLRTFTSTPAGKCPITGRCTVAQGSASGSASASAVYTLNPNCETATGTMYFIPASCNSAALPSSDRHVSFAIAYGSCDLACGFEIATPNGVVGSDGTCGISPIVFQICESGVPVTVVSGSFTDSRFDLDDDGRFSQSDVDLLQLLVPSSNSDLAKRFDLNGDGFVTQVDVDILQELIDCGLGAGLFGDANKDGVVDCCDLDLIAGALGKAIGESGYIIELDFNLDGVIDATDEAEMHGYICIADWNNDYQRNFFDSAAFIAAYNNADPAADLNGDGLVNFLDVAMFQNAFAKVCN